MTPPNPGPEGDRNRYVLLTAFVPRITTWDPEGRLNLRRETRGEGGITDRNIVVQLFKSRLRPRNYSTQ